MGHRHGALQIRARVIEPGFAGQELIAHELQHVVEVAESPLVVDPGALSALYRRIGVERLSHSEAFDTEAAKRVGEQVRRERGSAAPAKIGDYPQLGR